MTGPPFKDSTGRYLTKALFIEYAASSSYPAQFTLAEEDDATSGCASLYKLYMEAADPTEYEFAKAVFVDVEHWDKLTQCQWFAPHVARWRAELRNKLRAEGIRQMIRHSAKSTNAARWLAEAGWETSIHGRGRPSKDEINRAASEAAEEREFLSGAAGRVFEDDD